jgi:hypothetical protein
MAKLSKAALDQIDAAVKILRDDGVHIHKTYAAFQKSQAAPPAEDPPEEGGAPPKKDPPPDPDPDPGPNQPKGRRIWW